VIGAKLARNDIDQTNKLVDPGLYLNPRTSVWMLFGKSWWQSRSSNSGMYTRETAKKDVALVFPDEWRCIRL
jgi:hypothetical protein